MTWIRVLVGSAIFAITATVVACGEDAVRASLVGPSKVADVPEASLPSADAGLENADATAPPRRDYDAAGEPVVCTSTPCAIQLAAGDRHICALFSDGCVRCWGDDVKGQLGRGEIDAPASAGATPASIVGVANVTQISAAGNVTCARNTGGRVQCWGDNTQGQLGLQASPAVADSARHPTPADVALAVDIGRVDVGPLGACALATSGEVYCWGANDVNQLARSSAGSIEGPGLAELLDYEITRIGAARSSFFGLGMDGHLVGWGRASGRVSSLPSSDPGTLPTLRDVTSVAAEGDLPFSGHACAIAGGEIFCWGNARYGEHGLGVSVSNERLPVLALGMPAEGTAFPQQIAVNTNVSCVRMTDGTIRCCGNDEHGALGRGIPTPSIPPTSVFGRATAFEGYAVQVAVTSSATCALVQGGEVVCWGGNDSGQLGQGTTDTRPHHAPMTVVFE